jgi:hypothetical protein
MTIFQRYWSTPAELSGNYLLKEDKGIKVERIQDRDDFYQVEVTMYLTLWTKGDRVFQPVLFFSKSAREWLGIE